MGDVDYNYPDSRSGVANILALRSNTRLTWLVAMLSGRFPSDMFENGVSAQALQQLTPPISLKRLGVDGNNVYYAVRNFPESDGPMLLFVHGSPGCWKNWHTYMATDQLQAFGTRIAVDRPGFGASVAGGIELDLRKQARQFAALIPDGNKAVAVGHSLGGPIVGWMALDFPEKICGVVSISGSLAPELEELRWYNRVANLSMVRRLLQASLVRSNDEMLTLKSELLRLQSAWKGLTRPIWLVQGLKDGLVYPETVKQVAAYIPPEMANIRMLENEGHFVIWQNPTLIMQLLEEAAACCS